MSSDELILCQQKCNNNFLDLIKDCCHALADWRAGSHETSVLNEYLGFKFTSNQPDISSVEPIGPTVIAVMLAHHLVEPDNVSALTFLAELAAKPDLIDTIRRYTPSTHNAKVSSNQRLDIIRTSDDECIQSDWRKLARELSINEFEILKIQSFATSYESAATEVLNRFRQSENDTNCLQRLVSALKAIGRISLSKKVEKLNASI